MNIGTPNFPTLSAEDIYPYQKAYAAQQAINQNKVMDPMRQQSMAENIQKAMLANQYQRAIQQQQIAVQNAKNRQFLQEEPSQTQADITGFQNTIQQGPSKLASDIATNNATSQTILRQKLAEIAQKNAEARVNNEKVDSPFFDVHNNPVSQQYALNKMGERYGFDSDMYKNAKKGIEATTARNEYYGKRSGLFDYESLTAPSKLQVNAVLSGLGYDPIEGIRMLQTINPNTQQPYTIRDLAEMHGQKLEDVEARYPLTTASQTTEQTREIGGAEMNTVYSRMNRSLSPYSQGKLGEAKLAVDSLSKDPAVRKRVARYYGAQRAQLELAAIGGRTAGLTHIGKQAVEEFRNAQFGELPKVPLLRDPEMFNLAADEFNDINKYILKAARQETHYPYKKSGNAEEKSPFKTFSMDKIKNYAEKHNRTVDEVIAALKKKGTK